MARYMGGRFGSQVLKPATLKLNAMWTPTHLTPFDATGTAETGLGWDDASSIETTDQGLVVSKDGGVAGYRSRISLFLDQRIGIAILCNSEVSDAARLDSTIEAIDSAVIR